MDRVTEPELMEDADQARAYSEADFANPHQAVVAHFTARFPEFDGGRVIDLACGPADVTTRLARALPHARFLGVDGSDAMIELGRARVRSEGLDDRVSITHAFLPDPTLRERGPFDAAICTGALHHFHDPMVLWNAMRDVSTRDTCVLVQDLTRPESRDAAHALVAEYAGDEPAVLQHDYFHSLLAAFTLDEIREQLERVDFGHFAVDAVSDRHVVVSGRAR